MCENQSSAQGNQALAGRIKQMALKTDKLTASELARLPNVPIFNELQGATLAAKARTGRRYSVSAAKRRYHVQILSFALNGKGDTTGGADIEKLADFAISDIDHVIAYLDRVA
jgi:hypothetical protein